MIHDSLHNWQIYFSAPIWKQVFEFLSSLTPDSPDNRRIDLAGEDMYAAIMTYETCSPDESVLETHDTYIDIQMSLSNSEAIDWFLRNTLKTKNDYDPQKDRTLYHRPGPATARVSNFPGFFTVLFPHDAHMPKLMTGPEPQMVKKVVIKLNINALNKT